MCVSVCANIKYDCLLVLLNFRNMFGLIVINLFFKQDHCKVTFCIAIVSAFVFQAPTSPKHAPVHDFGLSFMRAKVTLLRDLGQGEFPQKTRRRCVAHRRGQGTERAIWGPNHKTYLFYNLTKKNQFESTKCLNVPYLHVCIIPRKWAIHLSLHYFCVGFIFH